MATFYWVGGSGTWNANDTTNWATSSGGAGYAGIPTVTDNVVFDANSGGTAFVVTVATGAACADFTAGSLSAGMTLSLPANNDLYMCGSLSLPATNFTWAGGSSSTARMLCVQDYSNRTFTCNGVPLTNTLVEIIGNSYTYTLNDAFSCGKLYTTSGTFDTAGYNLTVLQLVSASTYTKTIKLRSSVVTITGAITGALDFLSSTNTTFDAGTSSIAFSGNTFSMRTTDPITLYNVTATNTGVGTVTISGSFTYNNLTFVSLTSTASPIRTVLLANNIVVNGTLTCSSTSYIYRTLLSSTVAGTQRTITAAAVSLTNTDFQDIAAAGVSAPWIAPASSINYGNNSGITFSTATTLYWIGGSGNWSDGTHWSTTSGGSAANTVPTNAVSVVFDANSNVGTGTFTVTVDGSSAVPSACNDFTASGLDGVMTLSMSATAYLDCYGSLSLPATNLTWTGISGALLSFKATTTGKTITTNGVTLTNTAVTLNGAGGEWTLGSAFTSTTNAFTVTSGSFVTSNYNMTVTQLNSSTTTVRSISLGSSTLTLSAATAVALGTTTNLTWNAGTSTITCSGGSQTFNGGGLTFYNVTFSSAANGTTTINGANTFNNLTQTSRSADGLRIMSLGANQTVNGTLTLGAANTPIRRIQVTSDTTGTQRALIASTVATLSDVDFQDTIGAGTGVWSGTRLGDGQNNSGITFAAGTVKYWNLASGGNWSSTGWATSSGGAPNVNNFPLAQDTAIIENTGLNTGATIAITANWWLCSVNASTRSNAWTLSWGGADPSIFGDFNISSVTTVTGSASPTITFSGNGITQNVTTNGVTCPWSNFIVDAPGSTIKLNGNLTFALSAGVTGTGTLTRGTLDLNDKVLNCVAFSVNGSNTRALAFGTGSITLTGSGGTIFNGTSVTNLVISGTPVINCTYAGSTGTRTINPGTLAEAYAISFNITSGSDTVSISGTSSAFKNLDMSGFTGVLSLPATKLVYGNVTLGTGMTMADGTPSTIFSATSGTQTLRSNGVTIGGPVTINAPGATVTLYDALVMNTSRSLTITAGTFTTNNKNITCGAFNASGTTTRAVNLGSSTITVGGVQIAWNLIDGTNLTFNAGTSTINYDANNYSGNNYCSLGTQTYNNIVLLSAPNTVIFSATTVTPTIKNLTILQSIAGDIRSVLSSTDLIITGTFTASGSAYNSRISFGEYLTSSGYITVTTAAVSLSYVNIFNTIAAGASGTWTGISLGDSGGNQNITFNAPKTVYWSKTAGGTWLTDDVWSSTSGGATSLANYPLPQDTVIIDDAGVSSGAAIVFGARIDVGTIDCSSLTTPVYFTNIAGAGGYLNVKQNLTISSAVTMQMSVGWTFSGYEVNQTITSNGVVFTSGIRISGSKYIAGNKTFADAFTTKADFTVIRELCNLSNVTVTCSTFNANISSASANNRGLVFGSTGRLVCTGGNTTAFELSDATGFSSTGTSNVDFSYAGYIGTRYIQMGNTAGGTESNALSFNITAGKDVISYAVSTAGCVAKNVYYASAYAGTGGIPFTIYGDLTLSPSQTTTTSNTTATFAATSGTHTITSNGVTIDRPVYINAPGATVQLADALTMGATRTLTLTQGTFSTNNYNVTAKDFTSNNTNVRQINMGSSVFTLIGAGLYAWTTSITANLTLNSGTSKIVFSKTAETIMQTGNLTFYDIEQASSNTLFIYNGGTFNNITNSVQPTTVKFLPNYIDNDIFKFKNFSLAGTSGNLVTISSGLYGSVTSGDKFNLKKLTGGNVVVSYCNIIDSAASPNGYWYAPISQGNVDGGNNTGWNFGGVSSGLGFMMIF